MKPAAAPPGHVQPDSNDESAFVRRALAAIARSKAANDWVPAEAVLAKLEAKVTAARQRRSD